jgi:ankyrin repeat protein
MATFYPPIDWVRHRLHAAAAGGNKNVVQQLITEGADVNEQVYELLAFDDVAGTPLHVTVSSCPWNYPYCRNASFAPELVFNAYYEIVEALLSAGANVHLRRAWAGTPLHDAARRGLTDIVKLLVSCGVDINCKEDYEGRTPLHVAAENNCLEVVKYLLSKGAEIDEVAQRNPPTGTQCLCFRRGEAVGMTPLQLAAREGHAAVVKALVEAGASLDRATAINLAVGSKRQSAQKFDEIIDLLS